MPPSTRLHLTQAEKDELNEREKKRKRTQTLVRKIRKYQRDFRCHLYLHIEYEETQEVLTHNTKNDPTWPRLHSELVSMGSHCLWDNGTHYSKNAKALPIPDLDYEFETTRSSPSVESSCQKPSKAKGSQGRSGSTPHLSDAQRKGLRVRYESQRMRPPLLQKSPAVERSGVDLTKFV